MSGVLVLKLDLAGSGCANYRKAIKDDKGVRIDQGRMIHDVIKSDNKNSNDKNTPKSSDKDVNIDDSLQEKIKEYQNFKDLYSTPIKLKDGLISIGGDYEDEKNETDSSEDLVDSSDLKEQDLFVKVQKKQYDKEKYGTDGEVQKITLMRPGPGALLNKPDFRYMGMFDFGQYKIKNTIKVCSNVIQKFISKVQGKFDKIYLKIKGHSRGGVAGTAIFKNLSNQLSKFKNDKNENKVEMSGIFYDPVPGPDFWQHENLYSIDLKNSDDKDSNQNNLKTAIVVSTDPYRTCGFGSQEVKNSDVVILTSLGHSVGTQNIYHNKDGKYSKTKWEYKGKLYNYGEISDLEPGIYYQSNETVLLKKNEKLDAFDENKIYLDYNRRNAVNPNLVIKLEKIQDSNLSENLKNMNDSLNLKEIWKRSSDRKKVIIDLLNEKFLNKNITYKKNKFETNENKINDSKNLQLQHKENTKDKQQDKKKYESFLNKIRKYKKAKSVKFHS